MEEGYLHFPWMEHRRKEKPRDRPKEKKIRCKRNEQNLQSTWSWKLKLSNYFKMQKEAIPAEGMRQPFLLLGRGEGVPLQAHSFQGRSKGFCHVHFEARGQGESRERCDHSESGSTASSSAGQTQEPCRAAAPVCSRVCHSRACLESGCSGKRGQSRQA